MQNQKAIGRIFLIDDSNSARKLLKAVLTASEYEVFDYVDPQDALKEISEKKPDMILTDYEMPNMNGADLCKKIKADEATNHIPVVLLSMHEGDEKILECIHAGADDYLPKKMNPEIMTARINLILQAKKFREAQIELEKFRTYNATIVSIKHELNNVLAMVLPTLGLVEGLIEISDPKQKEKVISFKNNLERLANTIKKLQTLSTVEFSKYAGNTEMLAIKK